MKTKDFNREFEKLQSSIYSDPVRGDEHINRFIQSFDLTENQNLKVESQREVATVRGSLF